ncbi:hypothetical protein FB45DRAFT_933337 [Roridomyces roridus]|uniref:Uncharacterized protein n=1 Tax=Roridomyces roridus TaxID=1738132 RepID=A0AAD7FGA7_9AGAR|nr:hypothetical protein FB45DRAFT_933337 [Roridomyces roridus]
MKDLSIDKASLIALIIESVNIGISTTLSIATSLIILNKPKTSNRNWHLLGTLALIWALSIAHWIIDITRAYQGFIEAPEGAIAYYGLVSNPLEAAKDGVYITVTLVADHFMIYRVWMVWNRNWYIAVLPILLWIGGAVSGYTVTHLLLLAGHGDLFVSSLAPWALTFFAMSLTLNVVCTLLIAGRILWTHMKVRIVRTGGSYVFTVLTVLVESAALYSLSLAVLLTLYDLGLNSQYILLDWTTSLIGIAFSMIIYRLAMPSTGSTDNGISTIDHAQPGSARAGANARANSYTYPLTSVNVTRLVEVSRDTDADRDGDGGYKPQSEWISAV